MATTNGCCDASSSISSQFIIIGFPSSSSVVCCWRRRLREYREIVCLLCVCVCVCGGVQVGKHSCEDAGDGKICAWAKEKLVLRQHSILSAFGVRFGSVGTNMYAKYALLGERWKAPSPSCVCIVNWRASLFVGCRAFLGCWCCGRVFSVRFC